MNYLLSWHKLITRRPPASIVLYRTPSLMRRWWSARCWRRRRSLGYYRAVSGRYYFVEPDPLKTAGAMLRRLRTVAGLSVADVAAGINVRDEVYADIEDGGINQFGASQLDILFLLYEASGATRREIKNLLAAGERSAPRRADFEEGPGSRHPDSVAIEKLERLQDRRWVERARFAEQAAQSIDFLSTSAESGNRPLVFLCHSSGDKERVRELYRQLEVDGVPCWFDEEDLLPGHDWDLEIGKAIRASRYVLACLSKASITKAGYIQHELRKALDVADEQPEGSIFLIPVRLEDCEVPERLRRWNWVDLFKKSGYERLLRVLKADQK
jgi:transcriptional regulator with XRE-family HTH domain